MDCWIASALVLLTICVLVSSKHLPDRSFPELHLNYSKDDVEEGLRAIEEVASKKSGPLCVSQSYRLLPTPVQASRFDNVRQKADMAALLLQEIGIQHHNGMVDAVAHSLLVSERLLLTTRILSLNSTGLVATSVVWRRDSTQGMELGGEKRIRDEIVAGVEIPGEVPWYQDPLTSGVDDSDAGSSQKKFMTNPSLATHHRGWWTFPYYSCQANTWLLSYTVSIPPNNKHGLKGFLSFDVDISKLEVNQCERNFETHEFTQNEIWAFHGSHKCHRSTQCIVQKHYQHLSGWLRGNYLCACRKGFYTPPGVKSPFIGTEVEVAWEESVANISYNYPDHFKCLQCAPGCASCIGPDPCLASYNWIFRGTLLTFSGICVSLTLCLIAFVYFHRRLKVFKVASPIFLSITLLGCALMYSEMAAIFPILDMYSCIATKWTRHLGFCITYTALLMKTWRVSLTYRVKSAHKVKLTDKQLLQWMFPILLVMLIYLGTWTLSDPPKGEQIKDSQGLIFKQCSFNWWDHSIAIGEVLFLAWGIRVCYSVRHAESLFNEARLISYAIYNIAVVNIAMVAFHVVLFPRAGPDIKYMLGFIRTQLSTSTTIALVFGPKVVRVLKGQGDQWDTKARTRAVTASFSLNGVGLVTEHTPDLYQENEELKEEIQKLAGKIEFMRIVNMEMNNRHVRPKPGSYFNPPAGGSISGCSGGTLPMSPKPTTSAATSPPPPPADPPPSSCTHDKV